MGTRRTPHPAIADPTQENLIDVVKAIKESLEIGRMDRRGDPLDNWVTYRDIIDGGLASFNIEGDTTNIYGGVGPMIDPGGRITGPPPPGGPFLVPRDPTDIRPLPGRPTNVRTMAVWDGIMVKWDWPPDDGNVDWLGAVIWVSTTSVFSQGSLAGYTASNFWIHEGVGLTAIPGTGDFTPGVRYYWVAWFGRSYDDSPNNQWTPVTGISNQTEWTPHHYQPGVRGKTAIDPEYVLRVLTEQVTESQIYASLNTRINLIDYDSGGRRYWTPVQNRILAATKSVKKGIYAAIAEYAGVNITEDEIRGEYNIRLDLNGYVVGFGLSALAHIDGTGQNYGETSAFVIKADTFAVVMPGEGDPVIPFIVGTVNGVPTVGINGQLVVDGSITAQSIQANSIGADQINASSVWADIVNANRIISSTFSTGSAPQIRVEINGQGVDNQQYPLWYGWGMTSGKSIPGISEPYFYVDSYGSVKLAGNLYVTGTGKFWLGDDEDGNGYRMEVGGYNDGYLLWAGTGIKTTDPAANNWIFYIAKDGDAKFRGTIEAEYVSGEFTQVVPISGYSGVEVSTPSGEEPRWQSEYTLIKSWVLPASPFNNPDVDLKPGHFPWLQLQVQLYGSGQTAGTLRIEWDSGNGIWQTLSDGVYNIGTYGGFHQIFAVAPSRIYSSCIFRLWAAGRANEHPTVGTYAGLLMGIR